MEHQVPHAVKQARLERLIDLQNRITCEINASQVGRVFEVLVEGPSQKDPTKLAGFTRENKMMHFEGPRELIGQLGHVRAEEAHLWGFYGTLIGTVKPSALPTEARETVSLAPVSQFAQ
jgi:tRNA-2-methylthio-N6-dimethylallyladenosine synthase